MHSNSKTFESINVGLVIDIMWRLIQNRSADIIRGVANRGVLVTFWAKMSHIYQLKALDELFLLPNGHM